MLFALMWHWTLWAIMQLPAGMVVHKLSYAERYHMPTSMHLYRNTWEVQRSHAVHKKPDSLVSHDSNMKPSLLQW